MDEIIAIVTLISLIISIIGVGKIFYSFLNLPRSSESSPTGYRSSDGRYIKEWKVFLFWGTFLLSIITLILHYVLNMHFWGFITDFISGIINGDLGDLILTLCDFILWAWSQT